MTNAAHYARMADKMDRDPVNGPGVNGRATVPNGRGFATWRRFHPNEEPIWVNDIDGIPRALTPKQASVYGAMQGLWSCTATVRGIAATLKISPSTVSRAAVRLASFGLIAYLTGRGRYGGMLIVKRVSKSDGLERFRELAKAKVRAWAKAASERVSRLKINVASSVSWKEIEAHGLADYYLPTMDATLKRPWTVEELREAGIV